MKKPFLSLVLTLFVSYVFSQATNNTCATAFSLGTVNGDCTSTMGDLYLANQTTAGTCGARYDVWYSFTMPASSTTATIKVTLRGGSALATNNTYIELFTGFPTCPGTVSGGCNDISTIRAYTLTAGTTYNFRVNTTVNPNGSSTAYRFDVCVTSNDNCATATTIAPAVPSFQSTVSGASASGTPVGCATGTPNDDVWFKFVAGATNATVSLSSVGGTLNTSGAMIQAYSGGCGALVSIGCGQNTLNLSSLTANVTYYIRVYSSGATAITGGNALFNISVTPLQPGPVPSGRMNEIYRQTILSGPSILNDPWEVTYGPDSMLWVTEAKGYKVNRIDPKTGVSTTVLDLTEASAFTPTSYRRTFNSSQNPWPQGGMMGLAIHPQFSTNPAKRFVYVAYVHDYVGSNMNVPPNNEYVSGAFFRTWIVKFEYVSGQLTNAEKVCDTIRGSNDHNSGRMIIAPVGDSSWLFYACGDMGGGQFGNIARVNKAQDVTSTEGKILRFNLESDGDANYLDKFVPWSNPFNVGATQSSIWSTGIRNNQGFAYAKIWGRDLLYGSSHGPFSDDELNLIEKKKNYGHPIVVGYAADSNYDGARAGQTAWNVPPMTNTNLPLIVHEVDNVTAINTTNPDSYRDPLYSFYDTARGNTGIVNSVQYIYTNTSGAYTANGTWASEAPSGLDIYPWSYIPGWKNSILLASLKKGRVLRVRLNGSGTAVIPSGGSDTISYFGSTNRYRDIAFNHTGNEMFVIMDKSATTSGPSANDPIVPACPGCLQKYTFLGYNVNTGSGNRSYIPTTINIAAGKPAIFEKANKVCINAANGNNNMWVPITDTNSNIVAEINARGLDLDTVTTYLYTRTGTSRIKSSVKYLNRNITISPQKQPGGSIWIRLYISKAEFDQLVTDGGVGSIGALKILKNNDSCTSTIMSNAAVATTNISEVFTANASYVLQGDISAFGTGATKAASFYFATSLVTLPVELLTFKGTLQNNATLLQWKTAQEINTSHFDVERSTDGNNFSSIGIVTAQGNTTTETDYSYVDNDVLNLPVFVVYYRLKIVDANGTYKYSNVISVTLPSVTGSISIAPNPVVHEATVKIVTPAGGKIQWNITDNAGRVVLQNFAELKKGRNILSIDLSKLAAGIYYFNIQGAGLDQNIKVQKE